MSVLLFLAACTYVVNENTYMLEDTIGDDAEVVDQVETVPGEDGTNRPVCNEFEAADLGDVFDTSLNIEFYLVLDADTAEALDETGGYDYDWYVYDLEGGGEDKPEIEEVWIIDLDSKACVKLENVSAWLRGQSSFDTFTRDDGTYGIPNIAFETDNKVEGQVLPGGYNELELNGGGADSGIQREHSALSIARAAGFPAPKTTHVLVQTSFWDENVGDGVWAVYTLVERYKSGFFIRELPETKQAWEYVGGIDTYTVGALTETDCQWSSGEACDNVAFIQAVNDLYAVPHGPDWLTEASKVWDVEGYWHYKFLSYFLGAGDDCERNSNNCVVVQSSSSVAFGRQLLYSVDITADHPWYSGTRYDGRSVMTEMCKRDPDCRRLELGSAFSDLAGIAAVDPSAVARTVMAKLEANGWMRDGDEERNASVITFYDSRVETTRAYIESALARLDTTFDTAMPLDSADDSATEEF